MEVANVEEGEDELALGTSEGIYIEVFERFLGVKVVVEDREDEVVLGTNGEIFVEAFERFHDFEVEIDDNGVGVAIGVKDKGVEVIVDTDEDDSPSLSSNSCGKLVDSLMGALARLRHAAKARSK